MNNILILQILSLIEAEVPTFINLWQQFKASGMTAEQYIADIEARDADARAKADAEIAKDKAELGQ